MPGMGSVMPKVVSEVLPSSIASQKLFEASR